jgi:hypothetical protein
VSSIAVQLEKTAYFSTDKVKVLADIDNSKCGLPLDSIVINLVQKVQLKSEGWDFLTYNEENIIDTFKFKGIPAKTSTDGFNKVLEIPLSSVDVANAEIK